MYCWSELCKLIVGLPLEVMRLLFGYYERIVMQYFFNKRSAPIIIPTTMKTHQNEIPDDSKSPPINTQTFSIRKPVLINTLPPKCQQPIMNCAV